MLIWELKIKTVDLHCECRARSSLPEKENTRITSYSCKYEQMSRLLRTANQHTQTGAGTSKRTAGSKKRGVPVTVSAAPVAAPAKTRAGEKSTDRLWASNRTKTKKKNMISKQGWWNSLNSSSKSNLYDFPAREHKRHHDESCFECVVPTGVSDPRVMSCFLPSAVWYNNKALQRVYVDCMSSPPPPPSSHRLPQDLACILEEECTHSERCPPKLASHRAWETGVFPSPHSSAQGLHPRESFHHSLSAIHKQHPPTHTSSPQLHTHASFSSLCCTSMSAFLDFTHRLLLYWHSAASSLGLWAMWAPVPSARHAEVTVCPTCHCRSNKGVRCDTCPCYAPFVHFQCVSDSPGDKDVWLTNHTRWETNFWTLSRSLLRYLKSLCL